MSAGRATYNWISSIAAKQPAWFIGSLQGKGNYGAWIAFLVTIFKDSSFLMKFEQTTDPWQRARIVGETIHNAREAFARLSLEEKAVLAKQSETELRAGLELLSADKKRVMELVSVVDPPIPQ